MRDIKFRGKDIQDGEWVVGNLVKLATGSTYIIPQNVIANNIPQYAVDPKTVGQLFNFGHEYREGDIYLVPCDCDSEYGCSHRDSYYVVAWDDEYAGFRLKTPIHNRSYSLDEFDEDFMRLVGNIHDNPELLTGGNK